MLANTTGTHAKHVSDTFINGMLTRFINSDDNKNIHFSLINNKNEHKEMYHLRSSVYERYRPYLLTNAILEEDKERDANSYLYGIWQEEKLVATIRLTPNHFESENLIDHSLLRDFLGNGYSKKYLEWGRLVVEPTCTLKNLMPAVLIYAGMHILCETPYRFYFGYSTAIIAKLFKKFSVENDAFTFKIKDRLNQEYLLLKGDFLNDFNQLASKNFYL